MEINFNEKEKKTICFKHLNVGDCFEYHEKIYIRIPSACQINQITPIDAFCITTGKYDWFTFEDVIPLKSTLTLEYYKNKEDNKEE